MATIERANERLSITVEGEVEIDGFAPPFSSERMSNSLIIATYNIRYAVGSHLISGSLGRRLGLSMPGRRPRLVEHHLQTAARAFSDNRRLPQPDILALQEADKGTRRAGGHDIARELARALKMNYARASASNEHGGDPKQNSWYLDFEEHIQTEDEGDTGIALLSRLPFTYVGRIDLPWKQCDWRPRLALSSTIRHATRQLHLFNLHIDPHAEISEQLEQHEAVLARARPLSGACILLGDFNTLSKRSCFASRALLESQGFITPLPTGTPTWRSGLIRLHTDWIFVRGARIKNWGVARPLKVSDHWPVWAEIEFDDRVI